MKNKGHIIAKIVLIVCMSLFFIIICDMLKNIPESNVVSQHETALKMPTATVFDRLDKWFALKSDDFYYMVKPMSDSKICISSTLFSIILVFFLDITVGVGRSRYEERIERRKSQLL